MKSLFAKNFLIYAAVVIVGFSILGAVFIYQVDKYSDAETQSKLENTTARAVQSTSIYLQSSRITGWKSEFNKSYLISMTQLAIDCGGMIFVGDSEGDLMFIATSDGCYTQENGVIPAVAADAVLQSGVYRDNSNFFGYLSTACHIRGSAVQSGSGTEAMVFVAIPSAATDTLFFNLSKSFTIIMISVLLLTLLATSIVVRSTSKPLKDMAIAAKTFARGDFSIRVPLPKRQDELYELTSSFNNMADAVENMEETRRGLIANVSHDLRTPMTTIGGFVDGILDGTINKDDQEKYLRIISDEVKRLSRLASSMLEVSRLESGEKSIHPAVFDVSEMVRRIIIGFEQKLTDKNIEVTLDIPDVLNIRADRDGIFQAVYNLIDNAVKFVNQDGHITVFMAEKGGRMQCNIINSGESIDPERIKYIFDRFYKGDTSRNRNPSGSGLGLYIVKTVINRHGGDIGAKSADGVTEFCFNIPMNM